MMMSIHIIDLLSFKTKFVTTCSINKIFSENWIVIKHTSRGGLFIRNAAILHTASKLCKYWHTHSLINNVYQPKFIYIFSIIFYFYFKHGTCKKVFYFSEKANLEFLDKYYIAEP